MNRPPNAITLSPRACTILNAVEHWARTHDTPATRREVVDLLGLASTGSITGLTTRLERLGLLATAGRKTARTMRIGVEVTALLCDRCDKLQPVGHTCPGGADAPPTTHGRRSAAAALARKDHP